MSVFNYFRCFVIVFIYCCVVLLFIFIFREFFYFLTRTWARAISSALSRQYSKFDAKAQNLLIFLYFIFLQSVGLKGRFFQLQNFLQKLSLFDSALPNRGSVKILFALINWGTSRLKADHKNKTTFEFAMLAKPNLPILTSFPALNVLGVSWTLGLGGGV